MTRIWQSFLGIDRSPGNAPADGGTHSAWN